MRVKGKGVSKCSDCHKNMTAIKVDYLEGSAEGSAVWYATRLTIVLGQLLYELLLIVGEYCLAKGGVGPRRSGLKTRYYIQEYIVRTSKLPQRHFMLMFF